MSRRDLYIAMDITDRCNLRCAMCVRTALPWAPAPDLTLDEFRTIGDHCFHRAVVLSLSCVSEPLLSPRFAEIMAALAAYRVPSTELVTNGMLLDEPKIRAMLEGGLSRLIVSIDGATPETYESIRAGARWERLLANLELLQRLKAERRTPRPVLRLNFVMMRRNVEELPDLLRLAARVGASQVTAQHMTPYAPGSEAESLFRHQALANRVLVAAHRLAARSRITFNAPPLFAAGGRRPNDAPWLLASRLVAGAGVLREFGLARLRVLARNRLRRSVTRRRTWCHHPEEVVFLDPRANVRPCVSWGSEPVLGNCLRQSLDEILASPAYVRLRDELAGRLPKRQTCLHCPALSSGKVDDPTAFERR